ncbi:MAG: sigma-70 family RNA polymerase sigma factor, partial [Peptococcaceae bacterium]|nr:sigma-70 family RNA polymerase sigma factor [Peptococcaceae bacterium]
MAFKEQMLPDLPRLSHAQVIQYLKAAKEGDKAARDKLVNSNLRLISTMIRRFQGRGYEEEDLFQIGVIGLIKAIDRFDLSYDVQFSTYAVPMIIGEIKRFLRDDGPLKISRTYKDNLVQIRKAQEKLQETLGREPTLAELEEELNMPREMLTASLDAGCLPFSIDEAIYGDDGNPLYRVDQLKNPRDEEEAAVKHLALDEMMDKLEPREREIIRLR